MSQILAGYRPDKLPFLRVPVTSNLRRIENCALTHQDIHMLVAPDKASQEVFTERPRRSLNDGMLLLARYLFQLALE